MQYCFDTVLSRIYNPLGQQAGLSWITVLKKRDEYRKEFHNFDIEKVSKITPAEIAKKLNYPQLIRHKGKLESIVGNALACIQIQKEFGSLHRYLWDRMEGGVVLQNSFTSFSQVPSKTGLAEDLSEDLKKRGFKFFGPTIAYSFLQAAGFVNDHFVE